MEKTVHIQLPRTVVVGSGTLDQSAEVIDSVHLPGDPLLVATPTPRSLAAEPMAEMLRDAGRDPDILTISDASFEVVESVVETATEGNSDFLIAVGGGRPIDVVKAASSDLGVGFVSVPTAASHDGIVSSRSSIPDDGSRYSVSAEPPLAVIADTTLLADAPWNLTTAGYADIISNYTAVRDWKLANRLANVPFSEYAATLSEMTAELLVSNREAITPGNEYGAWLVMKALISSGVAMSIAGSSRPASGAEHMFSHRLDQLAPGEAFHGHQVGVGAILSAYLHGTQETSWRDIRAALDTVGAPTTAEELGIDEETVVEALATADTIRDRQTILGPRGVSRDAAYAACQETGVI